MVPYIAEIGSRLSRVDAGVKKIYDSSVANDRAGAWYGVQDLGPIAAAAHETIDGVVGSLAEQGMSSEQVAALRAISDGTRQWSQLATEMQAELDVRGNSPELDELFDQRLYDVYVNWRSAEDALHDAGGL
jgi:hypothetical protein